MFKNRFKKLKRRHEYEDMEENEKGPAGYEGKEHVRYEDPGFSEHHIDYPKDEPHMKSRVDREEEHEMEDDYHMPIRHHDMRLPKHIKRAHMKMEDDHPFNVLVGNLVSSTQKPIRDDDGQEREGPHDYQEDEGEHEEHHSKEKRKKMIAAVMKRKMKKHNSY